MICACHRSGHGREPTVFWGTVRARGGRLAGQRDVQGLDPDGCMVRRSEADTAATKTGTRLSSPVGGRVCLVEHNGKKLWKGDVLPLDKSLLMGV
jgi:hypothetical protein